VTLQIGAGDPVEPGELLELYESAGWSAYTADPDALVRAVAQSTYVVTARDDGALVGLARVLSDDVAIMYLQDVLVRPDRQREGVGRALLDDCLRRFAHVRTKVLLTDDEDRQHAFYRSLGFREIREVEPLHAFVRLESTG
jgi:ribosomal protein S18 acetylase RimI-like enzyme